MLYEHLRALAIEDVREAREKFREHLEGDAGTLDALLRLATSPGEGRMRHLIANTIQDRPERHALIVTLSDWLAVETDEFAKRAIATALGDAAANGAGAKSRSSLVDTTLAEVYRYVAGRLCHEVRNALVEPWKHVRDLEDKAATVVDPVLRGDLAMTVGALRLSIEGVGRTVQFDVGDEQFRLKPIAVCTWIGAMNDEFRRKYKRIELKVIGGVEAQGARIIASDHLLRLIFWNLWVNSHQAVPGGCLITAHATLSRNHIKIIIADNGGGFSRDMIGVAFRERFSRGDPDRGRGLLEVQDAVDRLHGRVELVRCKSVAGSYRVRVTFPMESP